MEECWDEEVEDGLEEREAVLWVWELALISIKDGNAGLSYGERDCP